MHWIPLLAAVVLNPAPEAAPPAPLDYPLDDHSRTVAARGKLACPKVQLRSYKGDVIRYHKPVTVYEGFVPRLQRFEQVVKDVAFEVYGRAPRRVRHLGTYNCRRIKAYPEWLSEHAFGNGIDIHGFEFGPPPKGADSSAVDLPRALRRPFKVTVAKHWGKSDSKREATRLHARFLDTLARRLVDRRDIFRVHLGPGYPGHHNHFHFDCGPYRMVEIW